MMDHLAEADRMEKNHGHVAEHVKARYVNEQGDDSRVIGSWLWARQWHEDQDRHFGWWLDCLRHRRA